MGEGYREPAVGGSRFRPSAASTPASLRAVVEGVTLALLVVLVPGGPLRLHQRLPRHRQRDRDVGVDPRPPARARDPDVGDGQLRRRADRDRGRRRRSSSGLATTPTEQPARSSSRRRSRRGDHLEPASPGASASRARRSHALIGGLLGAVDRRGGLAGDHVDGVVDKVLMPLVLSPILGITIGFLFMVVILNVFRRANPQPDERPVPAPPGRLRRRSWRSATASQRRPEDDGDHDPGPRRGRDPAGRVRRSRCGSSSLAATRDLARDGGRGLADHQDDGPERGEARPGPRLRGRDDRGDRSS